MSPKERAQPREPRKVRLPGFLVDHDIGLGDVIGRATSSLGIRACGPCEQRRQSLNRRVVFTGPRRSSRRPNQS
jgi:hypothetical protein